MYHCFINWIRFISLQFRSKLLNGIVILTLFASSLTLIVWLERKRVPQGVPTSGNSFSSEPGRHGNVGLTSWETHQYQELLQRATTLSEQYKLLIVKDTFPGNSTSEDVLAGLSAASSSATTSHLEQRSNQLPRIIHRAAGSNLDDKDTKNSIITQGGEENLILGMAQNTDPKNLAVFCESLRRHDSLAEVVIFINNPIPSRHQDIADKTRVQLRGFDLLSVEKSLQNYHPSTLRWVLFHQYLKGQQRADKLTGRLNGGAIWLIDVRDSYFQSDPFAFVSKNETSFHVFNGVEDFPIKMCGWNGGWIEDCFGSNLLKSVGSNRIICSGVSVGSRSIVEKYVALMSVIVSGTAQDSPTAALDSIFPSFEVSKGRTLLEVIQQSRFPRCERNGVDQGVHNVIVHTKALLTVAAATGVLDFNQRSWGQREGPVANMQARVARIRNNVVYNGINQMVAVVHQYDRYPNLQRYLFTEFVDWVDTNNFDAEWNFEESCHFFEYRKDVDMFKGMCDLKMRGGATSAASCCKFCTDTPTCRAFTFLSGQCFLKKCSPSSNQRTPMNGATSGYLKNVS